MTVVVFSHSVLLMGMRKVVLCERSFFKRNRLTKSAAGSNYAGVCSNVGYKEPVQWFLHLVWDRVMLFWQALYTYLIAYSSIHQGTWHKVISLCKPQIRISRQALARFFFIVMCSSFEAYSHNYLWVRTHSISACHWQFSTILVVLRCCVADCAEHSASTAHACRQASSWEVHAHGTNG